MNHVYCEFCGGKIIPYIDARDGKCHCESCNNSYSIQEYWKRFLPYASSKKENK